jgi:AcrR family transcriptional regulator
MPKARNRLSQSREPLSVERIEKAALKLIEGSGLAGFSTRKLANLLGCEAMSIYYHFPSKAHLMDALVARVLGEIAFADASRPWRERMIVACRGFRAMGLRHPVLFQFLALYRMNSPAGLRMLENVMQIFRDAGFGAEDAARHFRIIGYYITGATLDETSGYAKGPSAAEPVPEPAARRDYPLIMASGAYFKPVHFERTFEAGLAILLDGVGAALARAQA